MAAPREQVADDHSEDVYTERAVPAGVSTVEEGLSFADHDPHAFEVFAQFGGAGKPISHLGSVRAADPTLAWHAAKEAYTRREDCSLLWVTPCSSITMSTSGDAIVLTTGTRLTYRLPSFPITHRRAREAAGTAAAEHVAAGAGDAT